MDWVIIAISGAIVLVLAVWTVLREDRSTVGRGRHRGRGPRTPVLPPPVGPPAPPHAAPTA